jgi:hypothetical protein
VVALILLLVVAVTLPYRVAFEHATPVGWAAFDAIADVFFLLDIGLNASTAYASRSRLAYDLGEVDF